MRRGRVTVDRWRVTVKMPGRWWRRDRLFDDKGDAVGRAQELRRKYRGCLARVVKERQRA